MSHNQEFHIDTGQDVYLSMFDWDSNGYTYDLSIEFFPDNPNNSQPNPNPQPKPNPAGNNYQYNIKQ